MKKHHPLLLTMRRIYHCFSTVNTEIFSTFFNEDKIFKIWEVVKLLASEAGMQIYKFTKYDKEKEEKYNKYKMIIKEYSEYSQSNYMIKNLFVKLLKGKKTF